MQVKSKSEKYLMIENKIIPILTEHGFHLVDLEIKKEKDLLIIIFVFHPNKNMMCVESLGKLNKLIYPILEKINFLSEGFCLEISSPGIFRKLEWKEEFAIFRGKSMRIICKDGTIVSGVCSDFFNDQVQVTEMKTGNNILLDISKIKKASLNG